MKFNINEQNTARLASIIGNAKGICSATEHYFKVTKDSLKVTLFSNSNFMEFTVDISSDLNDGEEKYFKIDASNFSNTITKVGKNVEIEVGNDNKVTIKNVDTKNKISLTVLDEVDESTQNSIKDMLTNLKTKEFSADTLEVKISEDLLSFFKIAQKFMNKSLASNSICINRNVAKYADFLIILKKTLGEEVFASDEDIYLQKVIVDFIEPFAKTDDKIKLIFNKDRNKVLIECPTFGITSAMALLPIQFEYPTEDELKNFSPAKENEVVLTIGKDDLKNAFSLFNGTFRQELWKWETVTIDASKEYLDKGQIKVEHSDLTAECETFIPVSVSSNTADDLINFIISSSCISDFLNLVDGNSVSISMNGLALNEIHGPGIKIFSDSIEAICCKIAEADN